MKDDRLRKETMKGFQNESKDSFLVDEELVKKSREARWEVSSELGKWCLL